MTALPGLTSAAVAPPAPGRLGEALPASEAMRYIEALGQWRDRRKGELERLDVAALSSPERDALTGDVMLSMALWQAVADRHDLLLATWDSGRVGVAERERLASLVWGRLDAALDARLARQNGGNSALAVSLPEACRLSDALAAQLRQRLALDPLDADIAGRLRGLRAQLERIREQLPTVPAGGKERDAAQATADDLAERVASASASAARGGDVSGVLSVLESTAALTERDLIVGAAVRREAERGAARARATRAELEARGAAVRALADQCVAAVADAPRLAVPDVAALGPVPTAAREVEAYLVRLDHVSRAMTMAQAAYAGALTSLQELRGRLEAYAAKAERIGLADDVAAADIRRRALEMLSTPPVHVGRAEAMVSAYRGLLTALVAAGASTAGVGDA